MLFFPITVGFCYEILAKRSVDISRFAMRLTGLLVHNPLQAVARTGAPTPPPGMHCFTTHHNSFYKLPLFFI
ncbi:hypothetical protein DET57_110184 [Klebsiella oxytoca]|uniref:Uncharacterized protein n=1 Tax=Klebsiella oxytoca TaxID=571 RepID=A0A318FTG3_KLEOX|nr:hypothetical protein DET57_110184 [Klebsiella oxytoca]